MSEGPKAAGVSRAHYEWLEHNAAYKEAFETIKERAADAFEDEAVRRGVEGLERPVLHMGKQMKIGDTPLFERNYSDALLIVMLKALSGLTAVIRRLTVVRPPHRASPQPFHSL